MGSVYIYNQFVLTPLLCGEGEVWEDEPTESGIIVYSVVVPTICFIGIIGNSLSLMIFRSKQLNASVYTYLAVLASTDLLAALYLFIFGLSNGILHKDKWYIYDAIIGLPFGGFITCINVLTTVAITLDRVMYLWNPFRTCKPRLCCTKVARKVILMSVVVSIIFNIPFCFIFKIDRGELVTTKFFDSRYYKAINWARIILFGILPLTLLVVGNGFLIYAYKKAMKIADSYLVAKTKYKKQMDSMKFTFSLILMIIFFLIATIPIQLLSRTTVIPVFYDGDHDGIDSKVLEIARQVVTLTTAFSVSISFIMYYTLCPTFSTAFKKLVGQRKKKHKSFRVNVFLINNGKTIEQVDADTKKNLMKIVADEVKWKTNHFVEITESSSTIKSEEDGTS